MKQAMKMSRFGDTELSFTSCLWWSSTRSQPTYQHANIVDVELVTLVERQEPLWVVGFHYLSVVGTLTKLASQEFSIILAKAHRPGFFMIVASSSLMPSWPCYRV